MKAFCAFIVLAAFASTLTSAAPVDDDESDSVHIFQGVKGDKYRWPLGVFVYNINGTFTTNETDAIQLAMEQITKMTASKGLVSLPCITFRKSTALDTDIVQISNFEDKCSSDVGRQGKNQTLFLASSCFKGGKQWGTLAHEMIHALGYHHEQTRPDRDDYIEVLTENIKEKGLSNFRKLNNTETYGLPYDYSSIMHYRATEWSKDSKTLNSMKSKIEGKEKLMGQRDTLSNCDVAKLRLMYNCAGGTVKPTECKVE